MTTHHAVAGPSVAPADPAVLVSRNPADPADLVVELYACGPEAAVRAVQGARLAQPGWLDSGAAARSEALRRAGDAIEAAADDIAALIVRETGKPLAEARAETTRTAAIWRYYAQLPFDPSGEVHEPAAGPGLLFTRRRPHGVAGLITPWNFPFAIPSWKAAPALAAGNTVVLKPAPEATACALRLAGILGDVLPEGVVQVVPGGARVGEAVVCSADVVSFTGSTTVGEAVVRTATFRGVPVQAEMGGLNAALVLADADIPRAAAHLASAIAGYAGQKCTATSKVVAVGSAHGQLREALAQELRALTAADPGALTTVCGPVVSEAARDRVAAMRDGALSAGAALLAGGGPSGPGGPDKALTGWYIDPVLLEEVPDGHPLLTEEVFGPIAVLQAADDLEHAVRLANAGRHGLVTSLHTGDLEAALYAVDRLDSGMIRINAPSTGVDFHLPFGGEKASSHGMREQGRAALDFYTSLRTVSLLPSGRAA